MSTPEQRLATDGVTLLRGWLTNRNTENLRRLGELIVDLRGSMTLKDGRADWSGRSADYRLAMRDLFERAGLPEDQLDTVQAAIRYHVGNLLRERAEVEELEAVGLSGIPPKERLAEARRQLRELRDSVAAINRVRQLHQPDEFGECVACRAGCNYCEGSHMFEDCETTQALNGVLA